MAMKTAVATSPSMCRHCDKSATKLMVWVDDVCKETHEAEFCTRHFGDMISVLRLDQWLGEYL